MIRASRGAEVGSSTWYLGGVVGTGRMRILRNSAGVARRESPGRVVSQAILVVPGVALFVMALTIGFAFSLGGAETMDAARSLLTMLLLAFASWHGVYP